MYLVPTAYTVPCIEDDLFPAGHVTSMIRWAGPGVACVAIVII